MFVAVCILSILYVYCHISSYKHGSQIEQTVYKDVTHNVCKQLTSVSNSIVILVIKKLTNQKVIIYA